jgi:hypothetical protein
MRTDTGYSKEIATFLYSLEVQAMIEADDESELAEAQEAYGIPAQAAAGIVEACAMRFISQTLNLALKDAYKYNETGCVTHTDRIVKYMRYVSGSVDADGYKYAPEVRERLIQYYASSLKDQGKAEEADETAGRLNSLIRLTTSYIPPSVGVAGTLDAGEKNADPKKRWAWGG